MSDTRLTRTFGNNNPIHNHQAAWDGYRSVRLIGASFNLGLATTAYSYGLSYNELQEVAERIALLWNLHIGASNDELRTHTVKEGEAATEKEALRRENQELRQLAADRLNDAVRLTNEKTDYWLRIHALEKALNFILHLEIAPTSHEHAGSENGKQLIRARAAVRDALTGCPTSTANGLIVHG